jgi:hypothetical protein
METVVAHRDRTILDPVADGGLLARTRVWRDRREARGPAQDGDQDPEIAATGV